ncbi:hypothetical protein [Bradyrhizobium cosmicum]|uniref:Uncharacterized protein n=1 Tax=Bradyrhizobium cosmicum TaxID=1404864 RepID=A0AAI8MCD8_9BRAD|nr:hypothetical protein [Bradyrhizobium cosmicum]BAL75965.1 hypothetical protein S23_27530 [Bradyrhizobium cosmicum]
MEADFQLSDAAARFADLVGTRHVLDVALEAPLQTPPQLKACDHCGAGFLRCRTQRFCSRSCAALARPARTSQRRVRRHVPNDDLILRLLELSPFERASDGRWWFGTRRIGDAAVARLIAGGRAEVVGKRLQRRRQEAAE